jgi:hypothetical protein
MGGSCFFWRNTTNHLCTILEGLLGLESSLISGHTLTDDFGIFVDPDVWYGTEAAFDDF